MDLENGRLFKVLMFPWLAYGHITPFLELAKKLSLRNFHIYLCSTPVNLNSIKNKIPEKYYLSIQLVELNLPSSPELPPHYHTTNGLPLHLNPTLHKALKMSKPNFSNILKDLNPDLLIHDVLQQWAGAVAYSLNIPAASFLTGSAALCAFFSNLFMNPGKDFPFPAIQLRGHELAMALSIRESFKSEEKDPDYEIPAKNRDPMLFRTSREIEGKYIDYMMKMVPRKVLPVGVLTRDLVIDDGKSKLIAWLEGKSESSTVFVSFGSEYFLKKEEREEIAFGLEPSGVNFIWVVRFPVGEETSIQEALPEGFVERVGERGRIVEKWAPQARILQHPSIGGFVSHCGWNSVCESIDFGVPIIAMPMHLDQPVNAKLVVEIGVGVEVMRDEEGRLRREEIAKVIKDVVFGKTGENLRRKVKEQRENIRLMEEEEIDTLVEELKQLCTKYKGITEN